MFAFKRFVIKQDRCAMKVGTDGVLLGAWADGDAVVQNVLDVGTGTGLVALMLAQRFPSVLVDAIEIDEGAVEQACENVKDSPFFDRVMVSCADARNFDTDRRYDLIVCNPPYFNNSTECPDSLRTKARHSNAMTQEDLLDLAGRVMAKEGVLAVIYPVDEAEHFQLLARDRGLFMVRLLDVYPTPAHQVKRKLMAFAYEKRECVCENLIIELGRHVYSEDYVNLTRDFYLKF